MNFEKRKVILVLVLLTVAVGLPFFFRNSRYYMNIFNLAGIFIILTYGLNFIHGYLGLISIGHAGFFAVGAYVTAGLTMAVGVNYFVALPLAAVASALTGVLLGFPALRMGGHYFVLITLGFGEIVRLVILNWKEVTNGTNGVNNIPAPTIAGWAFDSRFSYYYLVLFFIILTMIVTISLRRSKYGRSMLALKVGELAATVMGVNPAVNKLINFGMSAFFAGLAGGLYASYINSISPEVFSVDLSVDVLTMLLVGGSGTIAGPVVGSVFLVFLKEWLRFIKEYYMVIYGAGIVLVMIFMPFGLVGLAKRILLRIQTR
jgi:branched-chain amino acid transport system permease protein